jgi:hypothetical protein
MHRPHVVLLVALMVLPSPASAVDLQLPAGFTTQVYVTGEGFDGGSGTARGIPAVSTMAFDSTGAMYLGRTGRRYTGGEVYDLWPIYRIPPGGGRIAASTEERYLYGPPLPNAQVGAMRNGRELFVSTFDRERGIGAVYRVLDGRAELFAGGTPPRGRPPLLRQPEAVALGAAGHVYVADREQGAVLRIDATGAVVDPRYVTVRRPRLLACAGDDVLWVGADGNADAPWQSGPGEIHRVTPQASTVVFRGAVPAAMAVGPEGVLMVADRHSGRIFALGPDGARLDLIRFPSGAFPRGIGFAPDTPDTRRAGIAGDLFVVTITAGAWRVNDILRISGPFAQLFRDRAAAPR